MDIHLLDIAQLELDEAIEYYNYEATGLGDAFLIEFLKATDRIEQFPDAWHPYHKNTRRCQMRRFPYGLIYQHTKSEIFIIAVANLHRNPDTWLGRIK